MQNLIYLILSFISGALVSFIIFYLFSKVYSSGIIKKAEDKAKEILDKADREAKEKAREAAISAKEKYMQMKNEFERSSREQKREFQQWERRLQQREAKIDGRQQHLDKLEIDLKERETQLQVKQNELEARIREAEKIVMEQKQKLEQIAGLSTEEAKRELIKNLEQEAKIEAANLIRKIEEEAKEQGEIRAKHLLGTVIQKVASEYVVENTVTVVDLPSDEMKGRIIGRDGRNIRSLEMVCGVDLIVDDTPGAVTISSFDPLRREIASMALKKLVADGRIHPARIEEVVEKCKMELENKILEEGEAAALSLGIPDLHIEILRHLGKLKYRTSYGQNVLSHSKEVAHLAERIALELKANAEIAKRAGLLHDIGKAIDREQEGTHIQLGVEFLRKYGESEAVIHAMECHHGDVEPKMLEAVIVNIADALSAARPGARRDVLEAYVRRLEKLEEIASTFQGVHKAYAVQAGRELRIIVESQKIKDEEAYWMAKDIARKIEQEVQYPGQIKVTVIRELRAIDYAK
ncbi:MAG: ribonuclease Y [Thermoanaerobaculia bacterium]